MRIAVIAEDYPPNQGGIAAYTSGIAHALVDLGHEVLVVAAHVSGDDIYDVDSPVSITRIGECNVRRKQLGIYARRQAVKRFEYELECWYLNNYSDAPPDFALVGSVSTWAKLCIDKNISYFVGVHGGDAFGQRADFLRTLYRRYSVRNIFKHAACIGANSRFTKSKIVEFGILPEKILVTYCGVSADLQNELKKIGILPLPDQLAGRFLILCRLVKLKAVDVVIRSIAILKKEYPEIELSIVGDGPEREYLEDLSRQLGVQENVFFIGYVHTEKEKAELFNKHDACIMSGRDDPITGRQETFGIVFAEAGAGARPCIGPRIGGVPEVISEGVTGLLVEPDDVCTMVKALETLMGAKGLGSKMGQAGRKRTNERFDYTVIAKRILHQM